MRREEKNSEKVGVVLEPTAMPDVSFEPVAVDLNNVSYGIYFQEVGSDLILIPNFSEKKSSEKILADSECKYGVNGGFYKKEGGALGLFARDGKILGEEITSATFNGYFWKKGADMGLDWSRPEGWIQTDFILQSGPLFDVEFKGSGKFVDEEQRRRVLVASDKGGKFYFVVIFDKDNNYGGPKLAEIAEILRASKFRDFDRALNLDGGSASAFYGENGAKLWEIANVGSFLCGK